MLKQTKNHADVRTTDRTRTSYTFQVMNRCGCDLCSAAIISRAATGTVGSRKFQLPLWIASCSVHGPPRPAVTLTLTWPRTFIMLHFATHTHDVLAFSSPAFSSPVFSASPPQQGVIPVEFRGDLWHQKTRISGLSCGVDYVNLRLAVLVEHRLVTNGQTDRQTDTGPWLVLR